MVRWEPGTPERLQRAALELFATRGYEQTTATEIARSVGLTERTFFRHFTDKREVLFHGQHVLREAFLTGVESAPADASPIDVVACALRSASAFFTDERRPHSRTRQSVIDRNPALQERESHKLGSLAAAIAESLRARGVDELSATLAAKTGMIVFGTAFTLWIGEGEERSLADIADEVLRKLLELVGRTPPAGS
ncbi:TetR/AcrR family transcriptional regulator [Streptantibioticus parmotrematis]|uniref:TetR/AcrR family transcriptional regulator n=1 Tax=Streptantibioticus parmotrematis TaxID=2873249 RepID=UPI00340FFB02